MNRFKKILLAAGALLFTYSVTAQDISVNITAYENGVVDGNWTPASTTAQVRIQIYNNGFGSLSPYKIRPLISIGSGITFDAVQPNLPAGWSIISNNGTALRFSNGTDAIGEFDSRDFYVNVTPSTLGNYIFTCNLAWSTGVAPGTATGPQTTGNDPANDGSTAGAFVVASVPLKLVDFSAGPLFSGTCTAGLNWETTAEMNVSHFEIEKSNNGLAFTTAGRVNAQGSSNNTRYQFQLPQEERAAYYRLKMVDRNGSFSYSETRKVTLNCTGNNYLTVYPNPVSAAENKAQLRFRLPAGNRAEIRLVNHLGQAVWRKAVTVTGGNQAEQLNLEGLAPGTYTVQFTDAQGKLLTDSQTLVRL